MYKDQINIGIIGSGHISDFHIEVIKYIKNVNLCSIYSKTLINAKKNLSNTKLDFLLTI